MIRFRCEHCGGWLSIAEVHATTTGQCPLCKQITRWPEAGETFPAHESDKAQGQPGRQGAALQLVREPPEPEEQDDRKMEFYCETQGPPQVIPQPVVPREQEPAPVSRARTIDVLLYPMNVDGLGATVLLALGFWAVRLFPILFSFSWYRYRVAMLIVTYYLFGAWCTSIYFAFCVFDTSKGGTRAPAVLPGYTHTGGQLPSLMLMGAVALCALPAAFYRVLGDDLGLYFWILASAGAFPLPMLLLACTLLGSMEALDPRLIVRSISATLSAYLGLVARLVLLASLAIALHLDSWYWHLPRLFPYAAYLYGLWVAGHLIGRFYLRHKGELQWDV